MMAAQIRVYLTPEEADHGTTRMVRPTGGDWVEVHIPPTRHDAVIVLGEGVRVRIVVVPSGIPGADGRGGPTGWRTPARIGVVVLLCVFAVLTLLLLVRGCSGAGPLISPDPVGSSRFHGP